MTTYEEMFWQYVSEVEAERAEEDRILSEVSPDPFANIAPDDGSAMSIFCGE